MAKEARGGRNGQVIRPVRKWCFLCGVRRTGNGEIYWGGHWFEICRHCYHAKLPEAKTSLEEMRGPKDFMLRESEVTKKQQSVKDVGPTLFGEQG